MTGKQLREKTEVAIARAVENRDRKKVAEYEELWRRAFEVKFVKYNKRLVEEVKSIYNFECFG